MCRTCHRHVRTGNKTGIILATRRRKGRYWIERKSDEEVKQVGMIVQEFQNHSFCYSC